MARLYKRGKYWWYQFKGQRYSTRCTDKTAAALVAREIERRVADPTYRPPNHVTLEAAYDAFVEQQRYRGKAEGTLSMYERHIRHLARLLGASTLLPSLHAAEWDGYVSTRLKEGAARTSVGKELSTVRGILKLARRRGQYPHALDEVMPTGFTLEYVPGDRHLREPELRRLLAALPPKRRAVAAYIAATGADWQSVPLARRSDVNFRAATVWVHGSKTRHRNRTIPILSTFADLVRYAVKYMPFEAWDNVRRDLAVACKRARVPKVTPRDLRRTHGAILRHKGVEPHLIGKMLGHADSRMVERVYGPIPADALAAVVESRISTAQGQTTKIGAAPGADSKSKSATGASS